MARANSTWSCLRNPGTCAKLGFTGCIRHTFSQGCSSVFSGTLAYTFIIKPKAFKPTKSQFRLDVLADANWAGCASTPKSTSGFVVYLFGTPVPFASRTQDVLALSSGESELCAIGSAIREAMFRASYLSEAGLFQKCPIHAFTDSSAAKARCFTARCFQADTPF